MSDTTQLPAFLRRRAEPCLQCNGTGTVQETEKCPHCNGNGSTPTGRLKLVLHCTWIQDYYTCPRKFWLRYGEMVESTGPRPALNYGGAVHEALAYRYSNPELPLDKVEVEQWNKLFLWFDAQPQPADEWRNCGRAQDLIRAYNEQYSTEDWQVLAVEEEFEVYVGNVVLTDPETGDPVRTPAYLHGRKDLVVAWHDGLWVVDHKTASDWGSGDSNSHLDEGRRSFQFRGYAWAERELQRLFQQALKAPFENHPQCKPCLNDIINGPSTERLGLPILGTVGNYLVSRKPYLKPPANGKAALPRNQFHREAYPFEPSVLDEWRDEFLDVAGAVLHDWQRGRWRSQDTGCGHWGRCEFYDYCQEALDRRADMLASSMFRAKEFEREL